MNNTFIVAVAMHKNISNISQHEIELYYRFPISIQKILLIIVCTYWKYSFFGSTEYCSEL